MEEIGNDKSVITKFQRYSFKGSIFNNADPSDFLSMNQKTDLIINQLINFKKNNHSELKEEHDRIISNFSQIKRQEDLFGYLIQSINNINLNLKELFEKNRLTSTSEELLRLREKYNENKTINCSKINIKSEYKKFTDEEKKNLLNDNNINSSERIQNYNQIFNLLREDVDIIIVNSSPYYKKLEKISQHNSKDLSQKSDRVKDNINENKSDMKVKYNNIKRQKNCFSWNINNYERNIVNLKKDVNHIVKNNYKNNLLTDKISDYIKNDSKNISKSKIKEIKKIDNTYYCNTSPNKRDNYKNIILNKDKINSHQSKCSSKSRNILVTNFSPSKKMTIKKNSIDVINYTVDYFTNPRTNPFTKNLPKYSKIQTVENIQTSLDNQNTSINESDSDLKINKPK